MRLSFFVAVIETKDEIFVSVVRLLRDYLIYYRYALMEIYRTTALLPLLTIEKRSTFGILM